jgi:hypothetical protein
MLILNPDWKTMNNQQLLFTLLVLFQMHLSPKGPSSVAREALVGLMTHIEH